MTDIDAILPQLLSLSHDLGDAGRQWAILGEGNTSARLGESSFLVKASGSQLRTLAADQLVEVSFAPLLEALHSREVWTDDQTRDLLRACCVHEGVRTPSVETIFHAGLLSLPGVNFVGHTHITSINSLLCSRGGWDLMQQQKRLFPDEVVVCGIAPCCVPYVDPGLPLARTILERVEEFIQRYGAVPKTIYLQNHGFIALGASASEVLSITQMADKSAHILIGAIACGEPMFMSDADVSRIANRPDEHLRQRALGLK
jgi:rhamnose utilization protein RhaD (predicted bifunctional aldolase and dehydrogenase)